MYTMSQCIIEFEPLYVPEFPRFFCLACGVGPRCMTTYVKGMQCFIEFFIYIFIYQLALYIYIDIEIYKHPH